MNITQELKKNIQLAIITALDAHYQSEDIDKFIADGVADVLTAYQEPEAAIKASMIPVKYDGHRETYYPSVADTGLWTKGQTKLVPEKEANILLGFAPTFVPGDKSEAGEVIEPTPTEEKDDEEEKLTDSRNMVNAMTRKDQVRKFVKSQNNWPAIPAEATTLSDMKEFAIMHIDRYGVL